MADITYCINSQCPFKECERHPSKISEACIKGKGYVSVASFDGVCRKYIGHLVDEAEGGAERVAYVDYEKAMKKIHYIVKTYGLSNVISDKIENALNKSTADVVEVKHGYNKTSMHPVDEFWCSECGFCCADYTETKYDEDGDYTYSCECEFDYCPRCGAKMDGGKA